MKADFEERFWSKVDLHGPRPHPMYGCDGRCWNWAACCDGRGYPQFWLEGRKRMATHIALMLDGIDVPPGMHAAHMCQNRMCVNPSHLKVMECWEHHKHDAENGHGPNCPAACAKRSGERHGSHTKPETRARGERNGRAKLTEQQVREIRLLKGMAPLRETAAKYGVSQMQVSNIQNGKRWKHV